MLEIINSEKKGPIMDEKKDNRHWPEIVAKGASFAIGAAVGARMMMRFINPPKKLQLKDKVVLITGGSRGLGLILARKLADMGAIIAICARTEEDLQEATADLATHTDKHLAIPCDITDRSQVKEMIHKIKDEIGSVDVLINNAGIIQVGPVETMNPSDYEQAMKTHFWGPFYLMSEVLPDMKEKKNGTIVNIGSIGSKVSFPHLLPYNASKYALAGLSEGMTAELKEHNINITTVYPGLMRTGSPRNIDVKGQHEKEYAWFKIMDSIPFLSMNADRAADKIIEAFRKGKHTLTLSIPAKLGVAAHGIIPGATITVFDLIERVLPEKRGDSIFKKGYESESKISKSFVTEKTDQAAEKNLET